MNMNKTFMSGYYQVVIEVAPASLSAAKVEGSLSIGKDKENFEN